MKKYILEIGYDEENEQIEYIQEEIVTNEPAFYYGDIDVSEYFDEEGLLLIEGGYIFGES